MVKCEDQKNDQPHQPSHSSHNQPSSHNLPSHQSRSSLRLSASQPTLGDGKFLSHDHDDMVSCEMEMVDKIYYIKGLW